MKRIEVAVGVVMDDAGRFLVGQRVVQDRYFNKWEFPGGKIEAGESISSALDREFREEVGISVAASQPLIELMHDYPDRHVHLHVYLVTEFTGQIAPLEGQALAWVDFDELDKLDFLAGNQPIIDALKVRYRA
jgi:8-oxo-dGTP diphosphatase